MGVDEWNAISDWQVLTDTLGVKPLFHILIINKEKAGRHLFSNVRRLRASTRYIELEKSMSPELHA